MTNRSTGKVILFDSADLIDIVLRADRVASILKVMPSMKEFDDGIESFERHYLGMMGEKAVEKYFNIPPNLRLSPGFDGGVDHVINGWKTQTKLRTYRGQDCDLIFTSLDEFTADIAILTRLESPVAVSILGCISKAKFAKVAKKTDYGHGKSICCTETDLKDVDSLLTISEKMDYQREEVAL